jgi:hypothetical protein
MEEEDTEETEIQSPLGPMYLSYRPKGKNGRKDEIKANWVTDANMNAETAKHPDSYPILGRFHGFSATGITLAEFRKIVQSLHTIHTDSAPAVGSTPGIGSAAGTSSLKIHPKVFNMIDCWISDSESPVVTEINLDAVERDANQFNGDGLKRDGDWLSYAIPDSGRFMRYRVVESKVSTTRSSIRKTVAARSQHRPLMSSTLSNGTFAETANRSRFAWFGWPLTARTRRRQPQTSRAGIPILPSWYRRP